MVTSRLRDSYNGLTLDPVTENHYVYAGADPANNIDLSGHDFSLGALMVGTSIGSFLNSVEGEAGDFILNSLEKQSVDWETIEFDLAIAFLPLAINVLGTVVSKFLSASLAAVRTGSALLQKSRYIYGPTASVSKIIDTIDELGALARKTGPVYYDIKLDEVGLYKGKKFIGRIETYPNGASTIFLRQGANMATFAEELYHHKQIVEAGLFGKSWSKLKEAIFEADVAKWLVDDLGFILNPNR